VPGLASGHPQRGLALDQPSKDVHGDVHGTADQAEAGGSGPAVQGAPDRPPSLPHRGWRWDGTLHSHRRSFPGWLCQQFLVSTHIDDCWARSGSGFRQHSSSRASNSVARHDAEGFLKIPERRQGQRGSPRPCRRIGALARRLAGTGTVDLTVFRPVHRRA
jgi:hypothetical protein